MIFESQFDRVIGLQFFMSFTSFPSLGNSVIMDSLWEGGWEPVAQLYVHAFRMYDPIMLHNFLYTLYGIPSEPGAESAQVFKAISSSSSINSFSIYSLEPCDSDGDSHALPGPF